MLQTAFAQKLNKELVYGHWTVYYASNPSFAMHTDSTAEYVGRMVKTAIAQAPSHLLSTEDSIKLVKQNELLSKWVDSSFIELDKSGKFKGEIYFTDEGDRPHRENGNFTWSGDRLLLNGKEQTVFSVKSLTAKDLVVIINEGGKPDERMTLKLKKK